jgi:hypothetical protein
MNELGWVTATLAGMALGGVILYGMLTLCFRVIDKRNLLSYRRTLREDLGYGAAPTESETGHGTERHDRG